MQIFGDGSVKQFFKCPNEFNLFKKGHSGVDGCG